MKRVGLFVVGVKTADFGGFKEGIELRFEEFCAEAFVNDAEVAAFWAAGGDFLVIITGVAFEFVGVGVESEREKTIGTEDFGAARFTDSEGARTAAIMKNQSLVAVLEVVFDGVKKCGAKIAVFGEIITVSQVDEVNFGLFGGSFGFFFDGNEGIFGFSEVVIFDIRGGGAEDKRDFEVFADGAGGADGRITGRIFLIIRGFVFLVDDDEAEVF